ncbi:MAG: hypothetical protein ACRC7D_01885 [Aeromonas popoffii]|uniref:hypothetical protein n=1 Tax=Aeromonas popoffii TaxID=70856 RepID=UPI003F40ADD9
MPAAIGLDGTRFNRTINQDEISSIASATSVDNVSSIWGRIADWFCGTKKEEAKKELFGLLHNDSGLQRVEHFTKLRDISSPAYKDNFHYEASHGENGLFNVNLKIIGVLEITDIKTPGKFEEVSEKIKLENNEGSENLEQMKKDIARFTYHCEGITYDGSLTVDKLEEFTSSMTSNQKKTLDLIASQTGMIAIKNGIYGIGDGQAFVGTPELQEISMSKDENGVVQVELTMKQNHQKERFDEYKKSVPDAKYPCLSMNATLKINPDGSHLLESVKVSHPGV